MTIAPITAARLRSVGLGLYCLALSGVGLVAIVLMVLGKVLVAFGNLWAGECDSTMKRCDAARARLAELEAQR